MRTIVRAALPGDFESWACMRSRLWPEAAAEVLREISTYFTDGRIAGVDHTAFIAERVVAQGSRTGDLLGFIELSLHEHAEGCDRGPVGFVEGWYVEPRLRRAGTGRALIAAAETWARSHGCSAMASDTTFERAALSVPAHLACGFVRVEAGRTENSNSESIRFLKPS